jgi:16S rRNA (guanine966-N2)-methyltransferase
MIQDTDRPLKICQNSGLYSGVRQLVPGQVRIIGGMWRGRKLKVPDLAGLRPTPDRVRETLFNWLQPIIAGAHCLDMFAGSGALGFEALSRGAATVDMVDQARQVVDLLHAEAEKFAATNVNIYTAMAPKQLHRPSRLYDIVFIDPPFGEDLLLPCCHFLEENSFLADEAYIYLEAKAPLDATLLPPNWQLLKNKKAGKVAYHLVLRSKE